MTEPAIPPGKPAPVGPSNLRLRVVSGVVLAALVLAVTWMGGAAFRLFAAAMALAIIYEWLSITGKGTRTRHHWLIAILTVGVMLLLVAGMGAAVLVAALLVAVAVAMVDASLGRHGVWPASGLAYAGFAAISLALLRGGDNAGLWALLFLFAVVWATDIAAYFVGRAIGGPKLAPSISPGKTWSGAIGGAAGGVLAGLLVAVWSGSQQVGLFAFLVAALALSVVAQLGDLFESFLKRRYSVKDSSNLIPGHGGVMDRVDGLVAAGMAFYVLCAAMAGPDSLGQAFFMP